MTVIGAGEPVVVAVVVEAGEADVGEHAEGYVCVKWFPLLGIVRKSVIRGF